MDHPAGFANLNLEQFTSGRISDLNPAVIQHPVRRSFHAGAVCYRTGHNFAEGTIFSVALALLQLLRSDSGMARRTSNLRYAGA